MKSNQDRRYKNIFSIPNGIWVMGGKDPRKYGLINKMKREGLEPGVPDLFLAWPSSGYHGLFIEFKAKTKLSSEQQALKLKLMEAGYLVVVCHGSDEAIKLVDGYLAWSNLNSRKGVNDVTPETQEDVEKGRTSETENAFTELNRGG